MSDEKQVGGKGQGQPDDSEPSPDRQAELEAAYEANVAAGHPPYEYVEIRTRGELRWVMEKRRWSGVFHMPEGYERATLTGADLSWADLSCANLYGATLTNATLSMANLSGVKLTMANLTSADLSWSDLSGADLGMANLTSAHLGWTNLSGAHLTGTNLTNAILSETTLTSAHLSGANLSGADLTSSRLDVTTFLAATTLSASTRLADVIWNNAPLTHIAWEGLPQLGDEVAARQPKDYIGKRIHSRIRLYKYQAAVRSYR